ncbi:MAG: sulfotransferase family 2 domain-containing protein [Myxococcota bacterium]
MEPLLLFTHIPKTAGTSFKLGVLAANYREEETWRYGGIAAFLRADLARLRLVTGHFYYGLHRVVRRPCRYLTILRDPIARAISHHFWVRQGDPAVYEHPDWKLHRRYTVDEILAQSWKHRVQRGTFRLIDNQQTRYLAGLEAKALPMDSELLLRRAKKHLRERYAAFGIQEEFARSKAWLSETFGWAGEQAVPKQKSTHTKPELSRATLDAIRRHHQLDLRLYDYARELFERSA